MTPNRPCVCDRYLPGRAYRAGRDCPKCWMFAHRPAARRAWGGDPEVCASLIAARRRMSAVELADLLAGPPPFLPEGWRLWPATREAHLILVDRFLAAMPSYPDGRFAGRAAVLCGGGRYEAGAYVACRMLRHVGWKHPIQVWHRGADEPVSAGPPAPRRGSRGRRGPSGPARPPPPGGLGVENVRGPPLPV